MRRYTVRHHRRKTRLDTTIKDPGISPMRGRTTLPHRLLWNHHSGHLRRYRGEHIMSLRGHTSDHCFRELALSLIILRGPLATSGITGEADTPTATAEMKRQERAQPCKICKNSFKQTKKHHCNNDDQGATQGRKPHVDKTVIPKGGLRHGPSITFQKKTKGM